MKFDVKTIAILFVVVVVGTYLGTHIPKMTNTGTASAK